MEKFVVEIADQHGDVGFSFGSIKEAKAYLAELPSLKGAREQLVSMGVRELRVVIKLTPDVGVCVSRVDILEDRLVFHPTLPYADSLSCGGSFECYGFHQVDEPVCVSLSCQTF